MRVRAATPADVDIIIGFNAAMASESEGLVLPPERLRAGVKAIFENPRCGKYWLCEREGPGAIHHIAGQLMITYEWSDWRNADFWWIQSVYTAPEHRNCGVYKTLHEHVMREARAAGACGVRLYVEKDNNNARAVYEHLGMAAAPYEMLEVDFVMKREHHKRA